MTNSQWVIYAAIGFFGDCAFVYLSWRIVIRPRLERYVHQLAREEITNLTGAC